MSMPVATQAIPDQIPSSNLFHREQDKEFEISFRRHHRGVKSRKNALMYSDLIGRVPFIIRLTRMRQKRKRSESRQRGHRKKSEGRGERFNPFKYERKKPSTAANAYASQVE